MTDREKLDIAVKFIKKIEKMDYPTSVIGDFISVSATSLDYDDDEIDVKVEGEDIEVILPKDLDDIKDEAWHVLADMEEL